MSPGGIVGPRSVSGNARSLDDVTHWQPKKGEPIEIARMTDEHVSHTIRTLRSVEASPESSFALAVLVREADFRGIEPDAVIDADVARMHEWISAVEGRIVGDWTTLTDEQRGRKASPRIVQK